MMDVLSLLDILNKTFQKSDCDLQTSLSILKSIRENLDGLRQKYTIENITHLIYPECAATTVIEPGVASKRKRTIPDKFQDSVLTDKLPIYRDMTNNLERLRALAVEVLDNLDAEFDNRFSEFNTELWLSFATLEPSKALFLDVNKLRPLLDFIKTIPGNKSES
jgi:hypothetical protein